MPGKAVRPDDKRHNNPGGYRGGVRPKLAPEEKRVRGIHQIRAFDGEWEQIKTFMQLVRKDPDKCKLFLEILKNSIS